MSFFIDFNTKKIQNFKNEKKRKDFFEVKMIFGLFDKLQNEQMSS